MRTALGNEDYLFGITSDNFSTSFNLNALLENSCFYPAAGTDGSHLEFLSQEITSFIHVDYSMTLLEVERQLQCDFEKVGYKLVGLKLLSKQDVDLDRFRHFYSDLNEHERERLRATEIKSLYSGSKVGSFALWALYEICNSLTGKLAGKRKRFSVLHIGGEACAVFQSLYLENKVNPRAFVSILPGEGYGDNWTLFGNRKFRLYQSILQNCRLNNALLPEYILTSDSRYPDDACFWSTYHHLETYSVREPNSQADGATKIQLFRNQKREFDRDDVSKV